MHASSELFVDETIRDVIREQYPGKEFWIEIPKNWFDIWDDADFPSKGEANLLNGEKLIGKVTWSVTFSIQKNGAADQRYIIASPADIIITWYSEGKGQDTLKE